MEISQEQIFFEIHKDIPREGPGNFQSTQAVFNLLVNLPSKPFILDVGCGPGKQTLDLAKMTKGKIIALDNHKPYLDKLDVKIKELSLDNRVSTKLGDMNELDFDENQFNIIWAEGSIYLMGFGKALALWKKFLKPNGYIVFSELCWFKDERPEEIENYWNSFYGQMHSIDSITKFLSNTDYKFIASYVLPDVAWRDDYYLPLSDRIKKLREEYSENPDAVKLLENESLEIDMHNKYSKYYGYSFFVVKHESE